MARPLLKSLFGADLLTDNGTATATAVVLDNSFSMQAIAGGQADKAVGRMEKAVQQATHLIDGSSRGGLWSVVSSPNTGMEDFVTPIRDKKLTVERLLAYPAGLVSTILSSKSKLL